MNKRELERELKKAGWEIEINNVDFRRQDAVFWYDYDGNPPIIRITKGNNYIELVATGEIRIFGKRDGTCFVFKGGNPDGEPTYYLRKHGRWENNNWFEIDENGSSYKTFEEAFYTLDDAVKELIRRAKKPVEVEVS